MVLTKFVVPLLAASSAVAQHLPLNRWSSGEVMDSIMDRKMATWKSYEALGYFSPGKWNSSNRAAPCKDGHAAVAGISYRCKNLDVTGYLTHADLGTKDPAADIGSSIWGVTIQGREFVAIGQTDGAAFAEIVGTGPWNKGPNGKPAGSLDYIGRLPTGSINAIWREIKSYKNYAIIGSEALGHGIQIFDMNKLVEFRKNRWSRETKVFSNTTDCSYFNGLPIGRSHNVVIAEASNHIVAVGAQPRNSTCLSGLIFIDVSDPQNPKQTGCADEDGYVHDAQCLIYKGPHEKYVGKEICYSYDENSLAIFDITNKQKPIMISNTTYVGASYTHQGWVLDPNNQEYLLMDDELDEVDARGPAANGKATTFIWDIRNLEKPVNTGFYQSTETSIDHNQYITKGYSYQSNYGAGLRILDVSSIPRDPTGKGIQEVAYFDVFPDDDENPVTDFMGTWANTGGWFKSGHIAINTFDRGVFVVKRSRKVAGGYRANF